MKKRLLKIGAIVAGVLIVLYLGCVFFLGSLVTAGVNKLGPRLVHVPLRLTYARVSPFTGRCSLSGLVVSNPPGWASDKAFAMETIRVQAVPSSLFSRHIIVKELVIDKPAFVYETKVVSSNIGDLLKNMDASSQSNEGQATNQQGEPLKFEVRHFRLQHGTVTVGVGPAAVTLPLPTIDLTDLGTKNGGITSDQLAIAIMRSVTSSIAQTTAQAVGKMGSTMGAAAASEFKSLFGHH